MAIGMAVNWNPWHGCHKLSAGCAHCYMYRTDAKHGRDSSLVYQTGDFSLPLRRSRSGVYKIPPGELVYTCFTSDFFVEEADVWRDQAWEMMRLRCDLRFLFITKRIDRFRECLPVGWGEGYGNVHVCCTVEDQENAAYRLPIFKDVPARGKSIICEPLLGPVSLEPWLCGGWVSEVIAGGESGEEARVCDYDWVISLREQCVRAKVAFRFKQTGAKLRKDGRLYRIKRQYQHSQAARAGIAYTP